MPYSEHGREAPGRPRDPNQLAKLITDIATGEAEDAPDTRDKAAVAMGKKGGAARAERLTPERRAEIVKKAAAIVALIEKAESRLPTKRGPYKKRPPAT